MRGLAAAGVLLVLGPGCRLSEDRFVEQSTRLYCEGVAWCDGVPLSACEETSADFDAAWLAACEDFDPAAGRACLEALEAAQPDQQAECEAFLTEIQPECDWSLLCGEWVEGD